MGKRYRLTFALELNELAQVDGARVSLARAGLTLEHVLDQETKRYIPAAEVLEAARNPSPPSETPSDG